MGIINTTFCISSFWNTGFWNLIFSGKFLHLYGFFEFLIPFSTYSMSIIFAYYCFSIKARGNENFWKLNFIANAINFILITSMVIFAKIYSMNGSSGAGQIMFIMAPFAVITTLNLALLLYRVPTNKNEENEIPSISETN